MKRDLEKFTKCGVNQQDIGELLTKATAFANGSFHNEYLGMQMFKTEAKNKLVSELKAAINDIMLKIEIASTRNSIMYAQFRNVNLSELSNTELVLHDRCTANICTTYLEQLTEYNVTQAEIDNIDSLVNQLTIAIDAQNLAIAERNIATKERAERANELYSLLSAYRNLGRKMWSNDEARSNDYIMYSGSSSVKPEEPLENQEIINEEDGTEIGNG